MKSTYRELVRQGFGFTSLNYTAVFSYDAAGRLVTEGNKTYRYGYLDKVMSVSEGDKTYTYMYHPDGQLARANYGGKSEEFLWDGLALIRRNDEQFMNEPHVGGGNPVASSKGTSYFNDILGTTVGFKSNGKYSAAALTAFGERLDNVDSTFPAIRSLGEGWFTGKPYVEGLGHAFLMRNYRAGLAKWQSADPMGYPDGWNQLAYCNNTILCCVDVIGAWKTSAHSNFFKYSIWYDGRRMKDKYLNLIVSADKAVDEDQSVENAYIHAMKTYSQTAEEANILINSCIEGHIVNAEDTALCYVNGIDSLDVVTAAEIIVRELGAASHTYQDRTCPAHYDSATNSPHTWFGTWLIDWRHFPELFLYVPNASIREYKSWIEALFHRVLLGNIDLINEIFE